MQSNNWRLLQPGPLAPSQMLLLHPVAKPRIPKSNLVKFKGDVTLLVPFWDSFKCAVHKNGEVSKIDKFNYLHSLLEGAAILSIQGIRLTADNYDSAIELLKNQFSNTHLIIATLF